MAEVKMAHPELRHPFSAAELGSRGGATVLYNDKVAEITEVLNETGLWVTPEDLTRINGFVLKPEGACLNELCIPVREGSKLLKTISGKQWFNVEAFAKLLEQFYIFDVETNCWSFGEIPLKRQGMMDNAQAPDFEVVDREGKVIRMADYKGKKALIITWSSW